VQNALNAKIKKITIAGSVAPRVFNVAQFLKAIKIAVISWSLIDSFILNTRSAMDAAMKLS